MLQASKSRLDVRMLIDIWGWERFTFLHDQEKQTVCKTISFFHFFTVQLTLSLRCFVQQKSILKNRDLPEAWRLAIAKKIENNLFSKVNVPCLDVG
jgi:hypothetical protein